jgi:hypothetical protein
MLPLILVGMSFGIHVSYQLRKFNRGVDNLRKELADSIENFENLEQFVAEEKELVIKLLSLAEFRLDHLESGGKYVEEQLN